MNVRKSAALIAGLTVAGLALGGCTATGDVTAEGPVEFTFLHRMPDKEGAKTVDDLIAEFNDSHPGTTVVGETMQGSSGESYPKIRSIVEAGKDVPCVAQLGSERVPDMLDSLMDVTEYAEKYRDHYQPAFFDKAKVGDAIFGLPIGASPIVMYYRADLFEKYGLELPKTWSEYEQMGRVVTERSGGTAYMGSFLTDEILWTSALATSEGADYFAYDSDEQAWEVSVDSPATDAVAARWQAMIDAKTVLPTPRWGDEYVKYLTDGTLVTHIGAPWESTMFADSVPDAAGSWKVAQIPHLEASTKTVGQNGGSVAAVLKGCAFPEQAVEFIDWWATNTEGVSGLGMLPAAKVDSVPTPPALKEYFSGQDIFDEYIAANENVAAVTWAPQSATLFQALSDAQSKVAEGGPVADIFRDGQDAAVAALTKAGAQVK
ncbi:extracellular solute-binding protein [Microbacterium sp.]|uniref:ABC transporter substrate-binding protein n=1 Tax=Microbacterium sp. TaxID=51671 RepID=UPI0028ABA4EA|nr:extracellular solute-binding protein [Microbacterium sp.]